MATSTIKYLGDLRTEATHVASGETMITDAPTDNQGKGMAFSPTDTTATSLATCMITTMGIAANNNGIKVKHMEGEVQKVMASAPRRIAEIHVTLNLSIEPDNKETRDIMVRAGVNCPVAKSLHPEIVQDMKFNFE